MRFKIINKLFSKLEQFPFNKIYNKNKRFILSIVCWITYLYWFFVGVYIRTSIEFLQSTINLAYFISLFGFYGFILALGSMCTFFFTDSEISNIYKIILVAIPIFLQIPIIIDYSMIQVSTYMRYSYVAWEDFLLSFTTFYLHPKIQSYAVHLGHPIMFISIMGFSSLFILYQNLYSKKHFQDKFIILIKLILYNISMYIIFQISGIYVPFIYKILDLIICSRTRYDSIIISNSFYFFIFLYIWLGNYVEFKRKNLECNNSFIVSNNKLSNNFNIQKINRFYLIEKIRINFQYKIKNTILFVFIIIYEWLVFILTLR
ncbi:MAG: hypothetical protein ACTSRP_17215 [Candidatus Helarchaeota archaeon]